MRSEIFFSLSSNLVFDSAYIYEFVNLISSKFFAVERASSQSLLYSGILGVSVFFLGAFGVSVFLTTG